MAANDFVSGTTLSPNTNGLTLFTQIMNIYRYGSTEIPEYFGDHIRDAHPVKTVDFSASAFMLFGPGRYIFASDFGATQKTLGVDLAAQQNMLTTLQNEFGEGKTSFSAQDLIDAGILQDSDFQQGIQQKNIDANSADYAVRTFIFNTQLFVINQGKIKFKFTETGIVIEQMFIAPETGDDNFDFDTGGGLAAQLGNQFFLEPAFDRSGLGEENGQDVAIRFTYSGDGRSHSSYTSLDYQVELADQPLLAPANGSNRVFLNAALGLISEVNANNTAFINFDAEGRFLIYGTNGNDTNLSASRFLSEVEAGGDPNFHIVGGNGEDSLFGANRSEFSDLLEGNGDDDFIRGNDGNDILVGGGAAEMTSMVEMMTTNYMDTSDLILRGRLKMTMLLIY